MRSRWSVSRPSLFLDEPELHALEARRRNEHVAELQEVERRHRLQDVDLVGQQALDARDPRQAGHDLAHVLLGHDLPAHHRQHVVELEDDLLEPQLEGLVDDDEQQLVVGRWVAQRLLGGQQLIEVEVRPVVDGLLHTGHRPDATCLRGRRVMPPSLGEGR